MYIFPAHLFNPSSVKADIKARVIDGGVSLSGDSDTISADGGGRWHVEYGDISLNSPELERLWKQWNSYLAGGARACLVPLLSLRTAPRPFAGGRAMRVSDLRIEGDPAFPSAVRYASPYIVANTVGSAGLRSTLLTINVTQGSRIKGGETFSVGRRAYVIERIVAQSGQQATCVISPPLREAIPGGSVVNFEWPLVQTKLALGQDLGIAMTFGYGTASLSFVEDFTNAS